MSAIKLSQLGPCQVFFGVAGAEVELGKTKGVNWRLREETAPITYDQTGTGPWDLITTGKVCEVEMNLANLDYNVLEQVLPTEAEWYGATATPAAGVSNDALDIRLGLGTSHRDNAKRLILRPYINGVVSTNTEDWVYFPLAFPQINLDWAYNATEQRVINTTFHCFPVSQNLPRIAWLGAEAQLPLV